MPNVRIEHIDDTGRVMSIKEVREGGREWLDLREKGEEGGEREGEGEGRGEGSLGGREGKGEGGQVWCKGPTSHC